MDVNVSELSKTYKVFKKEPGIKSSVKSLLKREYQYIKAVKDISFQIKSNEIVGLIGSNGSGKTTTLKMLSGLLSSSSGEISIGGINPFKKDKQFLKQLGFVTGQKGQLRPDLPAMDSYDLLIEIYELDRKPAMQYIQKLSEQLSIESILHQPVRNLSLGQRMKCELVASLIHRPKLLLLDEPTLGLDFESSESIRKIIKTEVEENNSTVILSSHILDDIQELCKKILIINQGTLVFDDTISNCFNQYAVKKIISARFKKELISQAVQIYPLAITDVGETMVSWEVERNQIANIAHNIMQHMPIEDITIKEPPLGQVVESIIKGV